MGTRRRRGWRRCASNSSRFSLLSAIGTLLSSLGVVGGVFRRLRVARGEEKRALQKLLRRLLEMGAGTREARNLFEAVVFEEKLDPEILDVIWFGAKSCWAEHFSTESSAALVLRSDRRTLPKDGVSFSVRRSIFHFLSLFYGPFRCGFFFRVFPPLRLTPSSRPQRRVRHDRCFNFRFALVGGVSIFSNAAQEGEVIFPASEVQKGRRTHLAVVRYLRRGSNPNLSEYSRLLATNCAPNIQKKKIYRTLR